MLLQSKKIVRFTYIRTLFLALLIPLFFMGARTYYLCSKLYESQSCKEAINLIIQNKQTFLFLHKYNQLQEKIKSYFYEAPKKSYYEALSDWVEARIMDHIEAHDDVQSVDDLPCLERSAIKSLDMGSYCGDLYQRIMCYITGAER